MDKEFDKLSDKSLSENDFLLMAIKYLLQSVNKVRNLY